MKDKYEWCYVIYDNYDDVYVGVARDFEDLGAVILHEAYVSLVERMDEVDDGFWADVSKTLSKELEQIPLAEDYTPIWINGGTEYLDYTIDRVVLFNVQNNL